MAPRKSAKPAAKRSTRQTNPKSSNNASKNGATAAERISRGRAVATRNSKGNILKATIKKSGAANKKTTDAVSDSGASQDELQEDEIDPDWEVDESIDHLEALGKDAVPRIKYKSSIRAQLQPRDDLGDGELITFKRGDRIWVLPDKHRSTIPDNCDKIEDLPDRDWGVAEIIHCCYLAKAPDTSPGDDAVDKSPIGFLEVVWLYTYKELHALKDVNIHASWVDRVKKYKLGEDERILTDHHDFVPLASFAGFADDIYAHLVLTGLEMSAEDRLSAPEDRKVRDKKDVLKMHGFERRTKKLESFATEEAMINAPDPPSDGEEEEEEEEDRRRGFKPAKKRRKRERDQRGAVAEEEDELQTPAPKQPKKKSRR